MQKKVTDKNFDFLKGTYYFRILSAGDYTFSVSNYVCNHYFDVVTTSPTYFFSRISYIYLLSLQLFLQNKKAIKRKFLKPLKFIH